MGTEAFDITIHVTLDNHGGAQEAEDRRLWAELKAELYKLAEDPKWAPIRPSAC